MVKELSDTVKREILKLAFEKGPSTLMKYEPFVNDTFDTLNRFGAELVGACKIRGFEAEYQSRKFLLIEYADETPNRRCVAFREWGMDESWAPPKFGLLWQGYLDYNPEELPGFNDSDGGLEYIRM